jgi:hypothetical protein
MQREKDVTLQGCRRIRRCQKSQASKRSVWNLGHIANRNERKTHHCTSHRGWEDNQATSKRKMWVSTEGDRLHSEALEHTTKQLDTGPRECKCKGQNQEKNVWPLYI